jgi:hypothetical protein
MPRRLRHTAGTEAMSDSPAGRACTRFGVPRSTYRPSTHEMTGSAAIAASAPRQSVNWSETPATPSAIA